MLKRLIYGGFFLPYYVITDIAFQKNKTKN